ncbi:MAG: hypothetical protein OCC49_19895, partial [Fibrobacterales bacterium]
SSDNPTESSSSETDSSEQPISSSEMGTSSESSSNNDSSFESIPIQLEVYTQRGGNIGTYTIDQEGEWSMNAPGIVLKPQAIRKEYIEVNAPVAPDEYTVIATSPRYYTEIYYVTDHSPITIDLDSLEEHMSDNGAYRYAGVTIAKANWSQRYCYGNNLYLEASFEDDTKDTIQTNSQGRYYLVSIEKLDSLVIIGDDPERDWMREYYLDNSISPNPDEYMDIRFIEDMPIAEAPYIYLYPTSEQEISVSMTFTQNAQIIKSIPSYNTGWNVRATPDGIIDDTYDFLFYDFATDKMPDRSEGWIVAFEEYPTKVPSILKTLHLNDEEIEDFMEFWEPYFDKRSDAPYFVFYMEDLDRFNTLTIDPAPDALLRVFLYIELADEYREIPQP